MIGIRTPVKGKGTGAGTSGPQESTSPSHPGNEGPSGVREAPKGISLIFGGKNAARGPQMKIAETPPSSSAGNPGATIPKHTPSPTGPSGQTLDAARTFIRRPERKRRSVENMEAYEKQIDIYATLSNDKLLQVVMRTFEEIPSKVKDYPQMRRDIKIYLETQSDKCLRTLFELSRRMKVLETSKVDPPAEPNILPTTPESSERILERLEKVESSMKTRFNDLEMRVSNSIQDITNYVSESGADIIEKVIDRVDEVSGKVDVVNDNLNHVTEGVNTIGRAAAVLEEKVGDVVGKVAANNEKIKEALTQVAGEPRRDDARTYANVAAAKPGHRPALHSMAVTLEGNQETADEVLARVKEAVDARGTGLKINKVRKAKNQTVILGCDSEAELKRVKERIESRGKGLIVAPMKNKNPLVVLKDVFLDSKDDEMVKALYSQNEDIFRDLDQEETNMEIKFKKRTRNPKTAHVVVQVRPIIWQRMTEAGALYLDLQRVRVEDQSPLIQCTKCLAFGHGRKFCTESADRCSHCGGPHLREKCEDFVAGNEPQCCNCLHSKLQKTDHNAFSVECPVRKKWDYLARTTTAYA